MRSSDNEASRNRKDGSGSALSVWSSCFAVSISSAGYFCRFAHFTGHWKGPDQPDQHYRRKSGSRVDLSFERHLLTRALQA